MKYNKLILIFFLSLVISPSLSTLEEEEEFEDNIGNTSDNINNGPLTLDLEKGVASHPYLILFYKQAGCVACKKLFQLLQQLSDLEAEDPVKIETVNCDKEPTFCDREEGVGGGLLSNPTLKLYIQVKGKPYGIRYAGNLPGSLENIRAFVGRHVGPQKKKIEPPEDEKNPGLIMLDEETFAPIVYHTPFAFIRYCTTWSGKCRNFTDNAWKEVARNFQFDGDLVVAQIDCEKSKGICIDQGIRSYPTLQFWQDGVMSKVMDPTNIILDPKELIAYAGHQMGLEEVTGIQDFFEDQQEPTSIIFLTKETFREYVDKKDKFTFVQFWTAWCSGCERIELDWENLAIEFNDNTENSKVSVANIDCVRFQEVCQQEGVDEFPTLRLYRDGKVQDEYKGDQAEKSMVIYLLKQIKLLRESQKEQGIAVEEED